MSEGLVRLVEGSALRTGSRVQLLETQHHRTVGVGRDLGGSSSPLTPGPAVPGPSSSTCVASAGSARLSPREGQTVIFLNRCV